MNATRASAIVAAALVAAFAAVSAFAITDGELDGDRHPYVGLMVGQDASGTPLGRGCSGTLISPRLFLTAGHCTRRAVHVEIWFDADSRVGDSGERVSIIR